MKKNQAVLKRVHKYRERRGLKIADTNSMLYKVFRFLYIIAFAWFMVIPTFFIVIPFLLMPEAWEHNFDLLHKILMCTVVVGNTAAFVAVLKKWHIAGGILNLIFVFMGFFELRFLAHNRTFDIDDTLIEIFGTQYTTDFIWRHAVPALLMLIFCGVLCAIFFREVHLLNRDYNKVLDALYITYKDRLHGGSEEEWEALLAELDDNALESELDRQHTAEYMKKKAAKEKQKNKTEEQTDQSKERVDSAEE